MFFIIINEVKTLNKNIENKTLDIVFDENRLFKQSNRLIESHYKLSLHEQKIMLAIISQLGKNQDDFFTCRINANDLAAFCNFKNTDKYTRIKNATVKLMQRVVKIRKDNNQYYLSHWVQSMDYQSDGTIIYKLDEDLKPELLQLKKAYLSEDAKPLMQFSSQYACRFYLLFKQYLKIGERKFTISELISMFQLNKKTYEIISNLRRRVIDIAINELNDKSDLEIKFDYIKEKRKVVAINFSFNLKYETEKNNNLDNENNDKDVIISALTHFKIQLKVAMQIKNNYSENLILKTIDKAIAEDKIKSKSKLDGFIVSAIKNDYYHIEDKSEYDKKIEEEKNKKAEEIKNTRVVFDQEFDNKSSNTIIEESEFLKEYKKHQKANNAKGIISAVTKNIGK